jgi:hypothetical protein
MSESWPLVLALFVIALRGYYNPKSPSIGLPSEKFWSLVKSQERPIVMLTTRGLFGTQMCYVFPYQGILFRTDAKKPEAPEGVVLIGAGDAIRL